MVENGHNTVLLLGYNDNACQSQNATSHVAAMPRIPKINDAEEETECSGDGDTYDSPLCMSLARRTLPV
jgi:hypothetical protein